MKYIAILMQQIGGLVMKRVILIVLTLAICCSAQIVLTVPPGGVLMPNVQVLSTDTGIFSCAGGSINSCQWVDWAGNSHAFGNFSDTVSSPGMTVGTIPVATGAQTI